MVLLHQCAISVWIFSVEAGYNNSLVLLIFAVHADVYVTSACNLPGKHFYRQAPLLMILWQHAVSLCVAFSLWVYVFVCIFFRLTIYRIWYVRFAYITVHLNICIVFLVWGAFTSRCNFSVCHLKLGTANLVLLMFTVQCLWYMWRLRAILRHFLMILCLCAISPCVVFAW